MPVQDLTPQLRTRLSRVERAVGWFVALATMLLLSGFGYYVYHTAQSKGWFLLKLPYHTFVQSAAGLRVGDRVTLMGFEAGQITEITPMEPFSTYGNVYVRFVVREPYYGYLWTDSYVKLVSSGLLGSRSLELVQGGTSTNKNLHASYQIDDKAKKVLGLWDAKEGKYVPFTKDSKGYSFPIADETPPVTERLDQIADQVQKAIPGILELTNQLARVLSNTVSITEHADGFLADARPAVSNLTVITTFLTNGTGSLGQWLIPTNLSGPLEVTLATANVTLTNVNQTVITANTNIGKLAFSLNQSLENLANITSNLNAQVQTNDQIVTRISDAIVHTDQLMQGLKHHWLLRSAFKNEKPATMPTNPPSRRLQPVPPKTGHRFPP